MIRFPPQKLKMKRTVRLLLLIGLHCVFADVNVFGQNPPGLEFQLATKNGRNVFRIGEPIELEFHFVSRKPGAYQAVQQYDGKRVAHSSPDRFLIEPSGGVVDPFADYPMEEFPWIKGFPDEMLLTEKPTVLTRRLNEWLSIRQPGRYRITAESRVFSGARSTVTFIPLHETVTPTAS